MIRLTALVSPNSRPTSQATRSKSAIATRPQFRPPTITRAESPKTSRHSRLRMRAEELFEDRKTSLEAAAQRALDLQMRDLPCAAFRDRTHFLEVASELMLLGNGKPTSTTEHRAEDEQLDSEIRHLLEQ